MTTQAEAAQRTQKVDDAIARSGLIASVFDEALHQSTSLHTVVEILALAGFGAVTLCCPTAETLAGLARLRAKFDPKIMIGVGGVISADEAEAAFAAGAQFLASPIAAPDVLAAARISDLPIYTGALSPTEILTAAQLRANAVRLMPADILSPDYLKVIRARIPALPRLIPAGGIALTDIRAWITAGAWAVELDTALLHPHDHLDAVRLEHRARLAALAVADARAG